MARFKASTETQTIIFPRDRYTAREARAWLAKHKKKAPQVDRTGAFLRYRQKAPGYFDKETFRTIPFGRTGIKAVIGVPKKKRTNPMEIIAINPRPKRRTRKNATPKKKGYKTMAKKRKKSRRKAPKTRTRTRTKVVYRTRSSPKRRRRRNPSRGAYIKQTIAGVNIPGAFRDALPMLTGALIGKAAAKKFALGGGEMENWTWANYLWCLGGGLIAGFATSALLKGSRATAQKMFTGALILTGYKFFTNEIAPKNATLESWFGQDTNLVRSIDPYAGLFGQVYEQPEGDYEMMGQHYVPANMAGETVVPATARLGFGGETVVPATARLGVDAAIASQAMEAAYR